MNLTSKKVRHTLYGEGTVMQVEENAILVAFGGTVGEKSFRYPEAFEGYLTPCDAADKKAVEAVLAEQREAARKEQERKERIESLKRGFEAQQQAKKAARRRPKTAPKTEPKV